MPGTGVTADFRFLLDRDDDDSQSTPKNTSIRKKNPINGVIYLACLEENIPRAAGLVKKQSKDA